MLLRSALFAWSFVVAAPVAPAAVVVVDQNMGPGADAPTITQGIGLAGPGDVVLVRGGQYVEAPVITQSLHLVGDGVVVVWGTTTIVNVPATGVVTLRRLFLNGFGKDGLPGLHVSATTAAVRLEDCRVTGSSGEYGTGVPGGHGVLVEGSTAVACVRCELFGGGGSFIHDDELPPPQLTSPGGHALVATWSSDVVLYESTLVGGMGGWDAEGTSQVGKPAGHAYFGRDSTMFASDTVFEGGYGGYDGFATGGTGADGGDGIHLTGPTDLARLLACTVTAGQGGFSGQGGTPGSSGVAEWTCCGAVIQPLPGAPQHLEMSSPVREGESLTLEVPDPLHGPVLVLLGAAATQAYLSTYSGSLVVPPTVVVVLPAGGTYALPVPELGAGVDSVTVLAQGLNLSMPPSVLSSFSVVTALDASF